MKIEGTSRGFSLIEVAFGLIIIGVIMTPLIMGYGIYLKQRQIDISTGDIGLVKAALQRYVILNGCYPLPAAPGAGSGNGAFGQEAVARTTCGQLTAAQLAGIPLCTPNAATACQTLTGTGGATVFIGDVPFAALGLPHDYIVDGYGTSKLTYAVTAALTGATPVLPAAPVPFSDTGGKIIVHDQSGANTQNGIVTTGNIQYIVVSHGKDQNGAFSLDGVLIANCGAVGAAADNENCNNDATFRDNYANNGTKYVRMEYSAAGANHYDDYVGWTVTTASDLWIKQPSAANILNNNGGKIRIGLTGALPPFAEADVRDTGTGTGVKADAVWTNNLCATTAAAPGGAGTVACAAPGGTAGLANPWPPKVFTPKIIAGTPSLLDAQKNGGGIDCTGAALTGIQNANELCATTTKVQAGLVSTTQCRVGWAPCGINPGAPATLRCRIPGGACN
jgi:prepilin-type N-terminal cleavage/methylation domain-containing protein